MTLREIRVVGDPVLRTPCDPIREITDATRRALKAMALREGVQQAADLTLDALSLASIYFLAAIGLAITFGVMGVINMAHGEFIMMGAYTGYVVQTLIADRTLSLVVALLAGAGGDVAQGLVAVPRQQAERLAARRDDPLKRFKVSDLDAEAQARWDAYSAARDRMLAETHSAFAPWTVVATDKKKKARLNILRHVLRRMNAPGIEAAPPDPDVVFSGDDAAGRTAP